MKRLKKIEEKTEGRKISSLFPILLLGTVTALTLAGCSKSSGSTKKLGKNGERPGVVFKDDSRTYFSTQLDETRRNQEEIEDEIETKEEELKEVREALEDKDDDIWDLREELREKDADHKRDVDYLTREQDFAIDKIEVSFEQRERDRAYNARRREYLLADQRRRLNQALDEVRGRYRSAVKCIQDQATALRQTHGQLESVKESLDDLNDQRELEERGIAIAKRELDAREAAFRAETREARAAYRESMADAREGMAAEAEILRSQLRQKEEEHSILVAKVEIMKTGYGTAAQSLITGEVDRLKRERERLEQKADELAEQIAAGKRELFLYQTLVQAEMDPAFKAFILSQQPSLGGGGFSMGTMFPGLLGQSGTARTGIAPPAQSDDKDEAEGQADNNTAEGSEPAKPDTSGSPSDETSVVAEVSEAKKPDISGSPADETPVVAEVSEAEKPDISRSPADETPVVAEVSEAEKPDISGSPADEIPVVAEVSESNDLDIGKTNIEEH